MRPRPVVGKATVPDAVRRLLDKFEYPDREFQPQIMPILSTLGGGGGGVPTVVVAASDASDESKAKADLVCTGVNDEITIQIALDIAGSPGRVLLTEGTYFIASDVINVPGNARLEGINRLGTVLQTTDTTGDMVTLAGNGELHSLTLQLFPATGNTLVGVNAGEEATIWNCAGVAVNTFTEVPGSNDVTVAQCTAAGCPIFIDCTATHESLLVYACKGVTIIDLGAGAFYDQIIGNDITQHIISTGGTACLIADNTTRTSIADSINLTGHDDTQIVGNHLGFAMGMALSTCNRLEIVANYVGIESLADDDGIVLTDCDDCLIEANIINMIGVTTDDTYDGIRLAGDSDRNDIWGNKIIGNATANQPRYGINISAATCDDNSYLGNRTGPASDYAQANPYNDAGTGTINVWPGAAAPQGDNLL